ncbi:MAG: PKD domain-containing protein, partial [Candidatus Omnitrophica bacterium]|nr:PKD domain-containing protein [Candidatus Omnitrophota bacterium]
MHRKLFTLTFAIAILVSLAVTKQAFCYRVPPEESNIRYLYVFGEDGKKSYGTKKEPQVVFVKVPASYTGEVNVSVYDPDAGGYIDEKSGKWNTETRFSIFGGKKAYTSIAGLTEAKIEDFYQGTLIQAEKFSEDKKYDKKFFHFSPLSASQGEKVGDFVYFKIVAEGLSGDDNNVFSLEVSPETVEAFAYSLNLRLAESRGTKMALYPEIPERAAKIVEYNFDLDASGGTIELFSASNAYRIKGSSTGMWANTKIDVPKKDAGKRWVYEITKATQPNANMAMYLASSDGNAIPVYFTPGESGPKRVFVEKRVEKAKEPWLESKISCNTFTFDGSKSHDPDNQALVYFWDFGDGTTSTEVRDMHTYKDAGKYLVQLTVTDNSEAECNTATTQQLVKVNQPPCAVAEGPEISCVNDKIAFDGAQSTDSPEDKLTYKWDFGDGETAEGAKVEHKYAKGGNYLVTLTVTDDSGTICDTGTDTLNIAVNTAPVADAGKDLILCKVNPSDLLEIMFDAGKSKDADGDKLTYVWDFGDGETAEGKSVTHRYAKGGEYIAKLLVTDNTDTDCNKSTSTRKVVLNRSPLASAGEDQAICLADKAEFDAALSLDNDGDTLSYTWDFGDGKTGKGEKVSHKYAKGGTYKVNLIVDDDSGTECSSTSDTITVDVNSTPTARVEAKEIACVKDDIKFDGASSSDPDGDKMSYTWDFGDGSTASGSNVKHDYSEGGLYKVRLFVDDGKGSECSGSTNVHYVSVNTPPVAEV